MTSVEHPSAHAAVEPDRPAVVVGRTGQVETYGELDARTNQLAHLLRTRGLQTGDHLALLLENGTAFLDGLWAGLRAGLNVTPVNWHLNAAEVGYIVDDCGASLLLGSTALLDALGDEVHLAADRRIADDTAEFESTLSSYPTTALTDECEGAFMFYSSGTTGRPKGIKSPTIGQPIGTPSTFTALMSGLYGFDENAVYLSTAPLYHAAPSGWTTGTHRLGGTAVIMERFDPLETLALIERYRVTHVQFVPTHMIRLLKLSEAERSKFDLSSLQKVIHAAAPCPVEVKQACMDWLGPVIYEYYSGSEGVGFCAIGPEEWLAHPGSVGKSLMGAVHILDDDGGELGPNEDGQVWFEPPSRFEYHGDPEKTAAAFNAEGWGTLGDIGHVDDDGYLYLTDRVSNMIISGGVNIYPREVEDVLVVHEDVADAAVLGVAHPEMGEAVRAVVQPAAAVSDPEAFAQQLIATCRERLAHYKCPTSVAIVETLPRLPTGKIARRLLDEWIRTPYPDGTVVRTSDPGRR